MLEIWQADAQGRFADPQDKRALPNASFRGFARCGTDKDGNYSFETIKPGAVPDPDGKPQAPHILLAVFGRGMLRHLYTRIYFSDEAGNAADPVLALVPADRRAHADRGARGRQAGLSPRPAALRATTRRCSSTCEATRAGGSAAPRAGSSTRALRRYLVRSVPCVSLAASKPIGLTPVSVVLRSSRDTIPARSKSVFTVFI